MMSYNFNIRLYVSYISIKPGGKNFSEILLRVNSSVL